MLFKPLSSILLFANLTLAATPVGIILPLTGSAGTYGQACLNGITLAREDLGERLKAELIIEDDQNSPAKTVSALRGIQQRHQAKIFLSWASNTSKAINQLAERENFILFAVATDPAVAAGKKNVFRYWVSAETEVRRLLSSLEKRSIRRVAVLTSQQDGLLSIRDFFRKLAPSSGVEILYDEEFSPDHQDFRTALARVNKLSGLQGVFNNLYVGQSGLFARQARELGVIHPIFAVEIYEDESVLKSARGALEGQFYINASDGTREFVEKYRSRFPGATFIAAANCYDFVAFLASAPDLSVDGFRSYLFNLKDFPGMVGKVSSTGDQSFDLPAIEKVIRGDQFLAAEQ